MLYNLFSNNGVTCLFCDSKEVVFLMYLSLIILAQRLSIFVTILQSNLGIEAIVTSSVLLIPRPPLDLGLHPKLPKGSFWLP